MLKSKTALAVSALLFLAVETFLGIRFQTGDHGGILRYISIIAACLFCALYAESSWAYRLTQLGLLLTLCADWFLVLPPSPRQLPGMLFFLPAQLAYAGRLYLAETRPGRRKWQIILRASMSVCAVLATILVLGWSTDAVAVLSMLYYVHLILNAVFAYIQFPAEGLLAVGFTLFILCDTLVGLSFLDGYFTIAEDSRIHRVIHPSFDLAWAFYLPSQMLLAASLLPSRWSSAAPSSGP